MRADLASRHHLALGVVLGLAVGDALGQAGEIPPTVCGHRDGFLPPWGDEAAAAFATAEQTMRLEPLPIDVSATAALPSAIRLAIERSGPPLLADPDAAAACGVVAAAFEATDVGSGDGLSDARALVEEAGSFVAAVSAAGAAGVGSGLVGALAGLRYGPGSIPGAWATYAHGSVGSNSYGLRQLRRLAERLVGIDAPAPPEPRGWVGPGEVAPRLWLSNMPAARRFAEQHPDGAIISLCPTTGALDRHPVRREFLLHDAPGANANPHLADQLDEILATIDAFHAAGRDVLVHCHHGASRTGLVLRAWLIERQGLDVDTATAEAQARWSKTSTWNAAFARELTRRATASRPV